MTIFILAHPRKAGHCLHTKKTTTTFTKIPQLNPLFTNTSFFMSEGMGRKIINCFLTSASVQRRWSTSTTPNSVTNCMLIIIITYLYSVFKRIILSCSPFYFSFTCTKVIQKRYTLLKPSNVNVNSIWKIDNEKYIVCCAPINPFKVYAVVCSKVFCTSFILFIVDRYSNIQKPTFSWS